MLEEQIPTYFVGDLICVSARVRAGSIERGIHRIVARFVHEEDTTREIELTDDPARLSECQIQEPDKIQLAGHAVDGIHPPGMYRCNAITAEYLGGRTIHFSNVPDMRFEISARSPEVVEWQWLRKTSTNTSATIS